MRIIKMLDHNRLNATAFWNEFHTTYPHSKVYAWMDKVAQGHADWFRELSLTNIAIAEQCYLGRFGFDQEKYEAGQEFVKQLLEKYQLTNQMQA